MLVRWRRESERGRERERGLGPRDERRATDEPRIAFTAAFVPGFKERIKSASALHLASDGVVCDGKRLKRIGKATQTRQRSRQQP